MVGRTGGLNLLDSDGSPLVTNLGPEIFANTNPTDVTVAPSDNIIVATDSAGLLEFAPSGALLDRFGLPYAADGTEPFRPGEFRAPMGLVVGVDGTVYVAETNPATGFNQVQAVIFAGMATCPCRNVLPAARAWCNPCWTPPRAAATSTWGKRCRAR
ncbi:MAG: hypothetical protein HC915_17995 [Anaerolineae bacterium]|nr:hypothetical protein [Anaerolineae bacterium]